MNNQQDSTADGRSDFSSSSGRSASGGMNSGSKTRGSAAPFGGIFGRALPLLMKREYWEHRGGFLWTPVWITGVILIFTVFGILSAEVFHASSHVHMGFSLDDLRDNISQADWSEAGNALDMAQLMFGGVTSIGVFFVLFFYLLGALYDDRRDRSVLFWKSLPVTDTATVASKALAAMFVAPVIAFVA